LNCVNSVIIPSLINRAKIVRRHSQSPKVLVVDEYRSQFDNRKEIM
jgi:hypothetical protein